MERGYEIPLGEIRKKEPFRAGLKSHSVDVLNGRLKDIKYAADQMGKEPYCGYGKSQTVDYWETSKTFNFSNLKNSYYSFLLA